MPIVQDYLDLIAGGPFNPNHIAYEYIYLAKIIDIADLFLMAYLQHLFTF